MSGAETYPAPPGWPPYSSRIVWQTCLLMELRAWIRQRRVAA